MASQWQPKGHHLLKPKLSFGRWISFTLFAALLLILYISVGSDDEMLMRAQSKLWLQQLRRAVDVSQIGASWVEPLTKSTHSNQSSDESCDGRRVFIYKLPTEFNDHLVKNCKNWTTGILCEDISNGGFGKRMKLPENDPMAPILQPQEAWFKTDQFSLEVCFHHRLTTSYPCLTKHPENASMFYIPFYHTLDVTRNLYTPDVARRDRLSLRFVKWLRRQRPWQLHHGNRHVLVLGRIVWDFKRKLGSDPTGWGSSLLSHRELSNVTKLLIERDPWSRDTIAIPYPTSFHPSSDTDLRSWQARVRNAKRHQLVSFAGSSRNRNMTGMVRGELFRQCANSARCNHVLCTQALCVDNPQTIYKLALDSIFCLQPGGDSPTRKGIFDTLLSGCIPVLFDEKQAVKQYLWHLPGNGSRYSVLMDGDAVRLHHYDVMQHLVRIPKSEIARMQESIVQLIPQLVYRNPALTGHYSSRDAIDVAMDSLFERFRVEDETGMENTSPG